MANPDYSVQIRGFNDSASQDYSIGEAIMFVDNPHNLGWTEYINEVGEAFWSMSQKDYKATQLASHEALLNLRPHVQIYRGADLVWAGWLGEIDENETDVVFYAYSYLSGFFDLITDFTTEWTGKTVAFIVEDVFDLAQAKSFDRVHWMTKGLIQNPWTTTGGPTGITMPFYRAPYKRILSVWKELAAYSISDTENHVIFEITPSGQFNFRRDRKSTQNDILHTYGGGNIRSYRRIRRPVQRRNLIRGVGTSPTDVNLNFGKTNSTLRGAMGISEEPLYFSFIRDSDELQRVVSLRLARATRVDTDLYVSFHRDTLIPARATNADYILGDVINIGIEHGISDTAETKVIAGQQVIYSRQSENVRLLLADRL